MMLWKVISRNYYRNEAIRSAIRRVTNIKRPAVEEQAKRKEGRKEMEGRGNVDMNVVHNKKREFWRSD